MKPIDHDLFYEKKYLLVKFLSLFSQRAMS